MLVFGGSLGARRLNDAALRGVRRGVALRVLHACGRRDHDDLRRASRSSARRRTTTCTPTSSRSRDALAAADLVVARAGGSVLELAAAGLPAVLVPYPHATADHQTANARWIEAAGAAVVVPDAELDGPRLAREVGGAAGGAPAAGGDGRTPRGRSRAPTRPTRIAEELLALAR